MVVSPDLSRLRPLPVRTGSGVSADVLAERIRRLQPDLDPESGTARAALVLLAGLYQVHNVAKLARFTGLDVGLVSICARRLVDNGVWRGADTICSWSDTLDNDPAFWADVAVAEGKLCRRVDDEGRAQWAPGGRWWKSFDLVGEASADQSVLYHSPPPPQAEAEVWTETTEDEPPAGATTQDVTNPAVPSGDSSDPSSGTGADRGGTDAGEESAPPGARSPELFPDAVWL